MLRFLLDTNTISVPISAKPHAGVLSKLRRHEGEMAIAATVWHELIYGWRRLPDSARKETLGRYLHKLPSAMPILPYDRRAARWHGEERARLAKLTPPPFDSQIAAVAAVNDLVLITANMKDFFSFDGLQIDNWMR